MQTFGVMDEGGLAPFEQGLTTEQLAEEKSMAKYSRSKEFSIFKARMESRMAFYRSYLPGGQTVVDVTEEERGKYWAVADIIIREFSSILNDYDNKAEAVKDATRKNS